MTNYSNAAEYERQLVAYFLRNEHCIYATRTPGSRSPVDVIALFVDEGEVVVHLIQCKNGTSRPKLSEVDFLKFARGYYNLEAYFMSRARGPGGSKFKRYELEEVEDGMLGPILDNGISIEDSQKLEARRMNQANKCQVHPRYRGIRRPRVKRGIEDCICYNIFANRS